MADLTGELIDGRYELIKIIANGGMGTIYEALDTRLDRKVAVKIMHAHLAQDEQFITRFIREAKAAASISHPNVVAVQDQGWNQSGIPAVFLVMELIEGSTLRDFLSERGKFSVTETINYLVPILGALSAAHEVGIVHRDMKPENVMISKDGRIKIADFGLARSSTLGNTMTAEASVILGSVSYLSPEQVQRGIADPRSDVYSVGIMAFEMLTGERPFVSDSPIQIAYMHVNEDIPRISSKGIKLPSELDDLLALATNRDPDKRPGSAAEFLAALRNIQIKLDPKRQQMSLELDLPPRQEEIKKSKNKIKPVKEPIQQITAGTKRKLSKRVRRNRYIATVLALVIPLSIWFVVIGPGAKVMVPSVVGANQTSSIEKLTKLGLRVRTTEVFSEDISAGLIIKSDPEGGRKIGEGGTVNLVVSKGPERYLLPAVEGLTIAAATELYDKLPLPKPVVIEEFSMKIPKDIIISSSPKSGTKVRRDQQVTISVSKGVEQIALNSYVGKQGDEALNSLVEAGFKVLPTYAFSETVPAGAVISQDPNTSGPLPKASKISIVISKGSEYVFVPNVFSLTESKATGILKDLGLKVSIKRMGTKKVKNVTAVSPNIGSRVKRGSTVTIQVG